ncbi:MAG: cyclohexanone monooxygenase, partial [Alphaproteobacteria bacterium]|nr:cyclohexanone monooxygenase [Alphaproteobacteria bacterium]
YNKAWQKGGLQFRASFQDILADDEANKTAAEFIKEQIRTVVSDKETAEKLANIDHPFATKRPPIDSHYFETYNEDHVHLIDVRSDPIDHIDEHGLVLASGARHDLDIIVFATGFDAMTGSLLNLNITGKQGQPLKEAWSAGPYTYLGLQVSGFPNMFTITGPGSPSVLCNMPVAIEQHVEWIADCIAYMREHDHQLIETDDEHCKNWVAEVNRAAEATLLPKANHSWYLGANVPGKPRVFMPYAGGMHHYRKICDDVQMEGYAGFHLQ